jgi:coenzyme F420-0:L-glutamate ligase/coenzyme F420-1:gamma-L-glutamate ligase
MAIGSAGFEPVQDLIGQDDLFGRPLEVSTVAVADELAAAASFIMGQAGEACPVVLIKGAGLPVAEQGSGSLIRPREQDLFR